MADSKVSDLTTLTQPTYDDLLYVVDDPGGTPASHQTTIQSVLPHYNVKQYGAKGNGTNNDQLPLFSAITAAQATGGTVLFPPGLYMVSNPVMLPSNVVLRGTARDRCEIRLIDGTDLGTGDGGAARAVVESGEYQGLTAVSYYAQNMPALPDTGPARTDDAVTLTRTGSTVVCSSVASGHGILVNNAIRIEGAADDDYNGVWIVTAKTSTTVTFDIGAATPPSPDAGELSVAYSVGGGLVDITVNAGYQPMPDFINGGNHAGGAAATAVGLYAAAPVMFNVKATNAEHHALSTGGVSTSIEPDGTVDEGLFNSLHLSEYGHYGWDCRGPHDAMANDLKIASTLSAIPTGPTTDYDARVGLYVDTSLQVDNVHVWGGKNYDAIWVNAGAVRLSNIVGEGGTRAQMRVSSSGGFFCSGYHLFGKDNYDEKGLYLDGMATATLVGGKMSACPGGEIYIRANGDNGNNFVQAVINSSTQRVALNMAGGTGGLVTDTAVTFDRDTDAVPGADQFLSNAEIVAANAAGRDVVIKLDNERMKVTANDNTPLNGTLTVERGYGGDTIANHLDDTPIYRQVPVISGQNEVHGDSQYMLTMEKGDSDNSARTGLVKIGTTNSPIWFGPSLPSDHAVTVPITVSGDVQGNAGATSLISALESIGVVTDSTSDTGTPTGTGAAYEYEAVDTDAGATYTLVLGDAGKLKIFSGGAAVTIPPNSSVAFPIGTSVDISRALLTAEVSIVEGSGVSLLGPAAVTGWNQKVRVVKVGTDSWESHVVGASVVPSVTGSRGGNDAVASIIAAGVTMGLWSDGSTA